MDKYDISSEKAEEILITIEEKEVNTFSKNNVSDVSEKEDKTNQQEKNEHTNSSLISSMKESYQKGIEIEDNSSKLSKNQKILVSSDSQLKSKNASQKEISASGKHGMDKIDQNVDGIISDIIPNYNQNVSIEVNHVDLTFEVSNEKVDTVKELFIRTLKRNKSKKLKIHALKDISFKIYKGEKMGIIGYNGAGKSTLLSVITGIYTPDKGEVKTEGNISPLLSLGAGFDVNYSGRQNIFLNGAVLGYDKDFLESKVDEIIEFSELGEFIDIPIKNYSSGMLAKLGFSIATAVEPDILIIDEILGVGDVNFSKKSRDKMKSLMDGGTTVLLVSHSIPQIREICDKAIWIDNGNLREIGEVNKVCDHYLKDAEKASKEQLENIQFR
ncbi:ABC transporter ATP-binding protein [Methanobrevibacter sp.]|uniref:ABC transporter ATP-binding protein n=1 Tax=Methanobrevibacter sp. TaxID=66852 RepID=UPI00386E5AF9